MRRSFAREVLINAFDYECILQDTSAETDKLVDIALRFLEEVGVIHPTFWTEENISHVSDVTKNTLNKGEEQECAGSRGSHSCS